ncbi:ecdysteroid kinase domain-containing protein [Ditylenchus destructor]|uniref:Ecdysteroid kinase domain-containing protein n=1 Tax=Ditylenchus destructor TaxID=166010 RepID=A0AAD4RBH4_9BILA|nr:ecdysteroid kinase domain-containing protein [Ditylenchus destructor]
MCPIHEWKLETISLPFLVKTLSDNDPSWTYGDDYSVVTELPKATWISEGKGYASKIYSVQISVGPKTHSIVIKILSTSIQLGQDGSNSDYNNQDKKVEHSNMLALAHNRELDFYTISSAFVHMKIPKFISGQKVECGNQGFLLMEDLSTRAKSDFNVARGLTLEQAKSLIEQMCVLQIQSLGIADLEKNFCQINVLIGAVAEYSRSCVEIIASKKYEWFDAGRAKEVLSWTSADQFSWIISAKKEFEMPPVLVHQDLWPGNILWEIGNSENQTESTESDDRMLAIVDWQNCHAGSFTSDLAAIIGVNSSGCLRQEHENELLDFYIQRMSDLSQLCSQAKNIRLNKSNVNASYKISLKCAVLQMAMTLVTNPTHDEIPANESEGPLTQRFRQLIEDIFIA